MGAGASHITAGAPRGEGKPPEPLQSAPSGLAGGGCQAVPQFPPPLGLKPLHPGCCRVMEQGPRRLVHPWVRVPGHAGSFWACRKSAPAAGEAELIPSPSAPCAVAFFHDFCWESAPFPPIRPVPWQSQPMAPARGGCFAAGTPGPQLIPCVTQFPAPVSLPASNPAAGPGNGSGPPRRQ